MNKEELEQMFDEKFYQKGMGSLEIAKLAQQKLFIFNEIIPEVLRSIIPELQNTQTNDDEINSMRYGSNDCIYFIKQKVKELFGIEL